MVLAGTSRPRILNPPWRRRFKRCRRSEAVPLRPSRDRRANGQGLPADARMQSLCSLPPPGLVSEIAGFELWRCPKPRP